MMDEQQYSPRLSPYATNELIRQQSTYSNGVSPSSRSRQGDRSVSSSTHFLERHQPLHPNSTRLNDTLHTHHLDVSDDDYSCHALVTRAVANSIGNLATPRTILGLLRLLKAFTFCFLVLTIVADVMYIIFLEIASPPQLRAMAGGTRDVIIRLYGVVLAVIALCIETGVAKVVRRFSGFKAFIPRSLLLLFIAIITGSTPIHLDEYKQSQASSSSSSRSENSSGNSTTTATASYYSSSSELPLSAVGFQLVTSMVLGLCALCYFMCGLMCLDRFTAKAFITEKDPRITTAIADPPGSGQRLNP